MAYTKNKANKLRKRHPAEWHWPEAVKQKGEGEREEVKFELWLRDDVKTAKGIVVISGHGSVRLE